MSDATHYDAATTIKMVETLMTTPGAMKERMGIWVTINPEVAEFLLTYNTHNRKPSKTHISNLARDMAQGLWIEGVADIAFTTEGKMANGQNTLKAVIQSEATIVCRLSFGFSPAALVAWDANKVRSSSDAAHIAGLTDKYGTALKAMQRAFATLERTNKIISGGSGETVTPPQHVAWLRVDTDSKIALAAKAHSLSSKYESKLSTTEFSVALYLLGKANPAKATEFFGVLVGDGTVRTGSGCPLKALDNALKNMKPEGGPAQWRRVSLVIRAWNAWLRDERVDYFKPSMVAIGDNRPVPLAY